MDPVAVQAWCQARLVCATVVAMAGFVVAACSGGASSGPEIGQPARFLLEDGVVCMVDFGRQFVSVFPLPVEASMLAPDAGPVWIETTSGGLQDWDETIDGVGVVRSYAAGRFMMSWDTQPVRYEPFGAANSITAPASAGPAIEELITELVTAPDHASVVALLEAATGATAAYTGPASTYDLLSFYDQPDQSGLLAVSGEPLSVERNTATWGAHDKPEPGLQVDLLGAETYARIDGQVLFWPGTAAPVEVPAESFADHVDELIDAEPTLVVTESPVLLFGCPAGVRGFGDSAAVEVAAARGAPRSDRG